MSNLRVRQIEVTKWLSLEKLYKNILYGKAVSCPPVSFWAECFDLYFLIFTFMQDWKILSHSMSDCWICLCSKELFSLPMEASFTRHSTGGNLLSGKGLLPKLREAQKMYSRDGNFTVIFLFSCLEDRYTLWKINSFHRPFRWRVN